MEEVEMSLKKFFKKYPWVIWANLLITIIIISSLIIAQRKENSRLRMQNGVMNSMQNIMMPMGGGMMPAAMMAQGNGMMPAMMPGNNMMPAAMMQGGGMMPAMMPGNNMMPAMMPQGNMMMAAAMPLIPGLGKMICDPSNCISPNPEAPLITRNAVMPHGWRGICSNCHAILGPRPVWIR